MHNIEINIDRVRRRIDEACRSHGRDPSQVTLLAVSKKKPASDIEAALEAGQNDFGESYVQEAETKIAQLNNEALNWHFIGPIQSNKTRRIAELFNWVHSVDRLKIAQRLNEARPQSLPPLNILLQVNIDADPAKSGIAAQDLKQLAQATAILPRLRLRGLMAIPSVHENFDDQRKPFAHLRELLHELQKKHPHCDCLSMGMSGDMEAAIAEGSTLVRIGTAIFGSRETNTV